MPTKSCAQSFVHRYLVRGFVNAKSVAPWYFFASNSAGVDFSVQVEKRPDDGAVASAPVDSELLISNLKRISISDHEEKVSSPQVRYILDYTLNRFCRWLRILGLDASLETEEEERLRTKEGKL
jgi:hypothetical protein